MTTLLRRAMTWTAEHPRAVDGLIAGASGLAGVISTAVVEPVGSEQSADAFAFMLVIAAATTLLWRRTWPLIALPVCVLFTVTFWVADYTGGIDPAVWLLFYAATRHGGADRRRVWQVVSGSLLVVGGVATVGVLVPSEDLTAFHLLGVIVVHATATAIGEALYQRSQHVRELELRAEALEADRTTQIALAAIEERTRIAREMHDIIAHGMSAVVVHAQAGQSVLDHDPEKVRGVLVTIENIGRDSTNELRRMLGVLREGDGGVSLVPQPTLADCPDLVTRAREAGVDASMEIRGDRRPVPPGVELTSYRVVQEALTNVVCHAGRPVTARVEIDFGDDTVDISIVDDGRGAAALKESAGSGHGLLGMRERVAVYDGNLRAGPRAGGGYEVVASLPVPARVRA